MNKFNKDWMKNINSNLLYRYWVKKGTSDYLRLNIFGAKVDCIKTNYGIISLIANE